jgi:hypothetical protein
MTVLTNTMKINHVGDGSTVVFPYDFKIPRDDEVIVKVDDVLISPSLYSLSGVQDPNGGYVTFNTAPVDTADILIKRNIDLTQLIDYRPYDPFPAETHEEGLDRIVMMIQQLNEQISTVLGTDIEGLMTPDYESGEYWRWDTDTQTIVTGVPVANSLNSATDSDVTTGTGTTDLTYSPAQLKLAVETHETKMVHAAVLPGTPAADTYYFIDE